MNNQIVMYPNELKITWFKFVFLYEITTSKLEPNFFRKIQLLIPFLKTFLMCLTYTNYCTFTRFP